jgi:hypothetical protein
MIPLSVGVYANVERRKMGDRHRLEMLRNSLKLLALPFLMISTIAIDGPSSSLHNFCVDLKFLSLPSYQHNLASGTQFDATALLSLLWPILHRPYDLPPHHLSNALDVAKHQSNQPTAPKITPAAAAVAPVSPRSPSPFSASSPSMNLSKKSQTSSII